MCTKLHEFLTSSPTGQQPPTGLGVLDLDKLSRVLRLRWLWQEWTEESKAWAGMEVPCNETDRFLFNASTIVTIGNGHKSQFWHNSWLDGEASRNLAPHLFALVKRKNRTVKQELSNNAWIKALRGKITSATHVEEFVSLWIHVQDVHLLPEVPYKIT